MDIKTLVELHQVLTELEICCNVGLPQTIDPDKLKSIKEVQEVIEKIVEHMKNQAVKTFNPL